MGSRIDDFVPFPGRFTGSDKYTRFYTCICSISVFKKFILRLTLSGTSTSIPYVQYFSFHFSPCHQKHGETASKATAEGCGQKQFVGNHFNRHRQTRVRSHRPSPSTFLVRVRLITRRLRRHTHGKGEEARETHALFPATEATSQQYKIRYETPCCPGIPATTRTIESTLLLTRGRVQKGSPLVVRRR